MTMNEAREYFISMGCSAFHMAREYPDRYDHYKRLHITAELEHQWTMEAFTDTYDKVLGGHHSENLWAWHSRWEEYMHTLNSREYFSKMLTLTRFVTPKETDGQRVVIAETINGRRDNKFRDGLIYGAYDCGMPAEAMAFANIALWLAEHDREPVPNENRWSAERVVDSRRKTESIIRALKL